MSAPAPAPPPRKHRQTPDSGSITGRSGASRDSREYYPAVEKGSSGMGVPKKFSERDYSASDFMDTPRSARGELPTKTDSILNDVPDAVVGADVGINGELEFERMVRIEGSFEGKLGSIKLPNSQSGPQSQR